MLARITTLRGHAHSFSLSIWDQPRYSPPGNRHIGKKTTPTLGRHTTPPIPNGTTPMIIRKMAAKNT